MKTKRQNELLRIINEKIVTTQEELLDDLRSLGFNVTQATVSRDMRELKISKVLTNEGVLRYAEPSHAVRKVKPIKFTSALTDSIVKLDYACNDVVIHTLPGLAGAVAVALEDCNLPSLLGCIAGDDTILLITKDEISASEICKQIQMIIEER